MVGKVALAQGFLPVLQFSPVSITSPVLPTLVHLLATLTSKRNGRRLRSVADQCSFEYRGVLNSKGLPDFLALKGPDMNKWP